MDTTKKYLNILSKQYPNIESACTEIINLEAILHLPKGTEHFLSDIHGEYEAFMHLIKNGSGAIKRKIDNVLTNSIREVEKEVLAMLIYYPSEMLKKIKLEEKNINEWYEITLYRLILVLREVSSKYTRSKVRKVLSKNVSYVIEEMLHEQDREINKQNYFNSIIKTIIDVNRADKFIIELCHVIQKLAINRLHIIGDIFDRGPSADKIMDELLNYQSIDFQWGNHDIVWMGAASGCNACIATIIRITTKYGNLSTLSEGYGINLTPLATFAMETYMDDECELFDFDERQKTLLTEREIILIRKIHKAITIIQFKLEGQIIKKKTDYNMDDRLLLDNINYETGKINIDGIDYPLRDTSFPTIDAGDPYKLSKEELEVVNKLSYSFRHNEKLSKHIDLLFSKGSMYLCFNKNLLFHGCIPFDNDGNFKKFIYENKNYSGKSLTDKFEELARNSYYGKSNDSDIFWYLWCGPNSPLFGKAAMKTFERYYIEDKSTWNEGKNPYYKFRDTEEICNKILSEYGLNPENALIINGHVPVKVKQGENPVKANGKLLVIDGGLSKAYQSVTGIAGYTLVYNSHGMVLTAHESFPGKRKSINEIIDIISDRNMFRKEKNRLYVRETDEGKEIYQDIQNLKELLDAYKSGAIKEKTKE